MVRGSPPPRRAPIPCPPPYPLKISLPPRMGDFMGMAPVRLGGLVPHPYPYPDPMPNSSGAVVSARQAQAQTQNDTTEMTSERHGWTLGPSRSPLNPSRRLTAALAGRWAMAPLDLLAPWNLLRSSVRRGPRPAACSCVAGISANAHVQFCMKCEIDHQLIEDHWTAHNHTSTYQWGCP
jgi:hypothetical protein